MYLTAQTTAKTSWSLFDVRNTWGCITACSHDLHYVLKETMLVFCSQTVIYAVFMSIFQFDMTTAKSIQLLYMEAQGHPFVHDIAKITYHQYITQWEQTWMRSIHIWIFNDGTTYKCHYMTLVVIANHYSKAKLPVQYIIWQMTMQQLLSRKVLSKYCQWFRWPCRR